MFLRTSVPDRTMGRRKNKNNSKSNKNNAIKNNNNNNCKQYKLAENDSKQVILTEKLLAEQDFNGSQCQDRNQNAVSTSLEACQNAVSTSLEACQNAVSTSLETNRNAVSQNISTESISCQEVSLTASSNENCQPVSVNIDSTANCIDSDGKLVNMAVSGCQTTDTIFDKLDDSHDADDDNIQVRIFYLIMQY